MRAYAADWRDFDEWCRAGGLASLPASGATLAAYVDERADTLRVASVRRRVAAVRARHVDRGLASPSSDPLVRAALTRAEWRRRHDRTTTRPLGVDDLRAVSRAAPETAAGRRDRALVLLGYGAGLAPGELAGLQVDDVRVVAAGIAVSTPRGRAVVPYGSDKWLCSVRACGVRGAAPPSSEPDRRSAPWTGTARCARRASASAG